MLGLLILLILASAAQAADNPVVVILPNGSMTYVYPGRDGLPTVIMPATGGVPTYVWPGSSSPATVIPVPVLPTAPLYTPVPMPTTGWPQ